MLADVDDILVLWVAINRCERWNCYKIQQYRFIIQSTSHIEIRLFL